MKYISWNVNSVRVRIPLIRKLIDKENPDVIMMQEIKCVSDQFPLDAFPDYECHVYGQKSYNGVAILLRRGLCASHVEKVRACGSNDARWITVIANSICIVSLYVPCGSWEPEKYEYKRAFLREIARFIESCDSENLVVGGDFNVAMTDEDVEYPIDYKDSILCQPDLRELMRNIITAGVEDRIINTRQFTWWDYRSPNKGLRLDYVLTRGLTGNQYVKQEYRRMSISEFTTSLGKMVETKPSDHAPVMFVDDAR